MRREFWDVDRTEITYRDGYTFEYPIDYIYYGMHVGEWVPDEMDMGDEVFIIGWVYDRLLAGPFDSVEELHDFMDEHPDLL